MFKTTSGHIGSVAHNCNAKPGEKCTEPTEIGRKKVAYIHTSRIDKLRKDLESR